MADDDHRWLDGHRYRVDYSIGPGGMSEVFAGYDERLDRRVAIKFLRRPPGLPAGPDSPQSVELLEAYDRNVKRFVREVRTMARLELAGIPAVYDTGLQKRPDGTDRLYIVMQFLPGTTVRTLLETIDFEELPPPVSWAAGLAAQVAAVLSEVHQLDIVHRDIKPENLILGNEGLVKVLDFGIAILRGVSALPRLTEVGTTVGTTQYMSPEQCLGRLASPAADIYSLGCLLHELLTGDAPFHGPADVLRSHHLHRIPSPVSAQRDGIPAVVDELVASMLAKDARERPSALRVYETLLPLTTVGGAGNDAARDPTRPFRRPLLAPALKPAPPGAAHGNLAESAALRLLDDAQALVDKERPQEAIDLLDDAAARVGYDPALDLQVREQLAATLFHANQYTRAAKLFDVLGRDFAKLLQPGDPRVLNCAYQAGLAYAEAGKPDQAIPQLRFYVQNAGPEETDQIRDARFTIAQMLVNQGDGEGALDELRGLRSMMAAEDGQAPFGLAEIDKQVARLESALKHGAADSVS
jgi:serine/threonine protein kinase